MIFEVGKFYKHSTGKLISIICEVETTFYGKGLLTESYIAEYSISGTSEDNAVNWTEISKEEWFSSLIK